MDNLTEQELKAVFDVLNVYDPNDIKQVYPEMGDDKFMQDVYSAWGKVLKRLKQNKGILKLYNTIGRDNFKEMFPNGVGEALKKAEEIPQEEVGEAK